MHFVSYTFCCFKIFLLIPSMIPNFVSKPDGLCVFVFLFEAVFLLVLRMKFKSHLNNQDLNRVV